MTQSLNFERQYVQPRFNFGKPAFDGSGSRARGLIEQKVNCNPGHFRHTSQAVTEAKVAAPVEFFLCQPKADHPTAGLDGHEKFGSGRRKREV
ncbi:MAG: hypothetical protein JOY62_03640 [Acidobacteriaceae bacterium]|nr:hypothetical protein [Acidobacteriaceae bacterium]MBV9779044.1 hypothetical protein [Acidobacteriaceae bacterium]